MVLKTNVPTTHIGIFRNYLRLYKEKKLTTIVAPKKELLCWWPWKGSNCELPMELFWAVPAVWAPNVSVDPNNRGRSAAARKAKNSTSKLWVYLQSSWNQRKICEYYVDTCNLFQERMNAQTPFWGNRSVRWGHDEAIVKQFTLASKSWVGTNGKTAIVPKDNGCSIMI